MKTTIDNQTVKLPRRTHSVEKLHQMHSVQNEIHYTSSGAENGSLPVHMNRQLWPVENTSNAQLSTAHPLTSLAAVVSL